MLTQFFKRKVNNFDYELRRSCLNCGTSFQGRFCSRCGEKVIEPEDRSVKNFLSNVFNAFTFIDGKFFKSLKTMLSHPGKMSADIAAGIREPYMKPVAFLFVGNFLYFLLHVFETFNTNLYSQMNYMPYSEYVTSVVNQYMIDHNTTVENLSTYYNASSTNWSKLLLIFLAVLLFPFVALLNYKKDNYIADHLLFSLEYITYIIFVPTIFLGLAMLMIISLGNIISPDTNIIFQDYYTIPTVAILISYFQILATKNFYKHPRWRLILNTFLMFPVFYVVIHLYRFVLFQVTMWNL